MVRFKVVTFLCLIMAEFGEALRGTPPDLFIEEAPIWRGVTDIKNIDLDSISEYLKNFGPYEEYYATDDYANEYATDNYVLDTENLMTENTMNEDNMDKDTMDDDTMDENNLLGMISRSPLSKRDFNNFRKMFVDAGWDNDHNHYEEFNINY